MFPGLCSVVGDGPLEENVAVRFQEMVGRIPDLMPLHYRHYGAKPPMIKLRHEPRPTDAGHLLIITACGLPHAEIAEHLPALADGFEETADGSQTAFLRSEPGPDLPPNLSITRHAIDSRYFLVERHECGIVSSTAVLYAGLYILGNLVRYKPAFWMDVIEGRGSGSSAIVDAFCNVATRRFTNDVLELIWRERFTYGTPGYLA